MAVVEQNQLKCLFDTHEQIVILCTSINPGYCSKGVDAWSTNISTQPHFFFLKIYFEND